MHKEEQILDRVNLVYIICAKDFTLGIIVVLGSRRKLISYFQLVDIDQSLVFQTFGNRIALIWQYLLPRGDNVISERIGAQGDQGASP